MKQKLITIILTIIAVVVPILIIPDADDKKYNILKLIVLLVSGLALLILLLMNYKKLVIDKKDIIILIFLGLTFISTLLSSNVKKSVFGETNRHEGLIMFCTYVIIYICSKKFLKYEKIKTILNILFWSSLVIGILGITQKYVSFKQLYPIFNKGMCSTFGNSNFFGSFISIVLPISCTIFIFKGNKRSFILSLVMFFNLIASGTRSAWVAFAIAGLLGLIYLIKERNLKYFVKAIILLLFFAIICIYLFDGFGFKSKTVVNSNINSTNSPTVKVNQIKKDVQRIQKGENLNKIGTNRFNTWRMAIKLIAQKPILGCGPDNFWAGLVQNCTEDAYELVKTRHKMVDKAHNEYLHIAATIGIPALVCYLVFLAMILLPKIRLAIKNKIYFIFCLTIISYLAQAFFNISTIGVAPLFWMILGLIDNKEFVDNLNNNL